MTRYQKTIKKEVAVAGIGLHCGQEVSMTIKPAREGSGIIFARTDIPSVPEIPARIDHVVDCHFATTIGNGQCRISTIEHLMAAFAGMGIDNARVELNGPEVPALDGSASAYVMLFQEAGLKVQNSARRYIEILEEVSFRDGDKKVTLSPCRSFHVDFTIDFEHPAIRAQRFRGKIDSRTFTKSIARARTFGFLKEVDMLHKNGLALGASLDNAVVIGAEAVINSEGLRFSDEFVRHKVLDLIGDFYLLGAPLKARVKAVKSGHELHCNIMKFLAESPSAWRLTGSEPEYPDRLSRWGYPVVSPGFGMAASF
jgi:UDP-3-O-[3-hydroxymyristoyl] N-acetylglucosamine deacetylase